MKSENVPTILDALEQYRDSDNTALICGEEILSYRQLLADAKHIARGLAAAGVKKGDRVLYRMRRTADAIRGLFGILYAGGVYVSAAPDWPEERVRFVSGDAQTVFALTDESCRALLEQEPVSLALPEVRGEDEAAIYYTSGSTGLPKGVVLRHAAFGTVYGSAFSSQASGKALYSQWNMTICFFSLSFVAAIIDFCIIFSEGRSLLLPTEPELASVERVTALMGRHHPDILAGTPSVVTRFLENPEFAGAFAELNYVFFGGERLTSAAAERLSQATKGLLLVIYGSTEMFFSGEYRYRNDGRIHLGKAGYGVSFHILDAQLEEIPPGREGELFIGGMPAKYGHYLKPDLDAEAYLEHPRFGRLFRTGDLARLEADGEITLVGRADGMVKLHGQRIEIGEIENALASFPGVLRAAATIQRIGEQEALCGFYTAGRALDERELRRHLAQRLPLYMIPAFLRRLPQMPENRHGKLDYHALPPISPEKPLISILTPVHDVPPELFERACRSVLSQDYDRERIEWLVAVHNMDDRYLERLRAAAAGTPVRVQVFLVKEPRGLLGSARNALLERATGRYLFWLDADDALAPGCISRSVEAMGQYQADMLLFPCEVIRDSGTELVPRQLNLEGTAPVVCEKGDPRSGEWMTGCAGEVWSWCYRSSFLRETGIRFNEAEAGHFCDALFVIDALLRARRSVALPGENHYIFHIRGGSDSRNRVERDAAQTGRELLWMLEAAVERAEQCAFDLNQFLWFWVRNICCLLGDTGMTAGQKQALHNALLPLVRKLRILAPGPVFPAGKAAQLAGYVAALFPEASEAFRRPRWMHRQISFASLPPREELIAAIREMDYVGFRTLHRGAQLYLGSVEETAAPEVVTVDLRGNREQKAEARLSTPRQRSLMQGYRRVEELRGFAPEEVPCRLTLFRLNDSSGELLITWDARFIPPSAVEWLLRKAE